MKPFVSVSREVSRGPFLFSVFVFRAEELRVLTDFGVKQI